MNGPASAVPMLDTVMVTGVCVLYVDCVGICMLVIVRSGSGGVCTFMSLCLLVVVFVGFCYCVVVVCYVFLGCVCLVLLVSS